MRSLQPITAYRLLLGTALVSALLVLLSACSGAVPPPEPVRAVRTLTVAPDSAGGTLEFAAEVRPRVESQLAFRVPGKLVARSAEVGQRVRAGEVLARIDAADLQLGRDAAAAAVRTAQVQFDQAAAEYKRFEGLRAQNFISEVELERRAATLNTARAQLEQAKAQAAVQGNQAGYAALTATAAGIVTAVEAEVGSVLAAGTPVLRLAHDGPRDAVFAVPEDGVAAMRALLGQAGAVQVRLWGDARSIPATVREVAAAADPATRTFTVKADLGGAPAQLGQTATALLELPRQTGVTKVPLAALMQHQGRTAVWRLDTSTMTVQPQPVTVAGADGNMVVIGEGLTPGQVVVTAGVHVLNAGQKVKRYIEPVAPAAAASSAPRS